MTFLADDIDAEGALALDPRHHACSAASLLEGNSLLNVSLQKARDREARGATRNLAFGLKNNFEGVFDRAACAILDRQYVYQLSFSGEHRGAHHARGEAGPFFVH